jgi:hypothetical protein
LISVNYFHRSQSNCLDPKTAKKKIETMESTIPPPVDTNIPSPQGENDDTPRSRHGSDADKLDLEESQPVVPTTPPVSLPPPPPSGAAANEEEDTDGGDILSPLPMPFPANDDMSEAGNSSSSGGGGGGGFFGAIRQRRRSSIPVIATAQGAGATLEGKVRAERNSF